VLVEAMDFCKQNNIGMVLVSELSRLGRNAFETLSVVKELKDNGINIYLQKEQFSLFDKDGKPSVFSAIMIATLSTCAEMERQNISYRLNSGRAQYIKNGGKLGRPVGSGKGREQLAEEYKHVIKELKRGTSVRRTAKLCDVSTYTVQKIKNEFGL
jgi:DNA invertase Pin-like site-specific DNA recombinase